MRAPAVILERDSAAGGTSLAGCPATQCAPEIRHIYPGGEDLGTNRVLLDEYPCESEAPIPCYQAQDWLPSLPAAVVRTEHCLNHHTLCYKHIMVGPHTAAGERVVQH